MEFVSESLRQTIIGVHGDDGIRWLNNLKETLAAAEKRFNIRIQHPFPGLSFNLILTAVAGSGTEVALKLGVPSSDITNEIRALHHFDSQGMVRTIDADLELGAILLERVKPGTLLSEIQNDEQATLIFTNVVRAMRQCAPIAAVNFPTLADWGKGFERLREHFGGTTGPFPRDLVERAEHLHQELDESTKTPVLLHGDLHHDNILNAGNGAYVAIDPKGVIGDPCFESVAFLRNYLLTQDNPKSILSRRIDLISEHLGYDRERIVKWGIAHSVLSAWWCIEGSTGGWEDGVQCAKLFAQVGD